MTQKIGYMDWLEIGKTAYKTREEVKELLQNDTSFRGYRFASREETVFLMDCYFQNLKHLGDGYYEPGPAAKFIEDLSLGKSFEQPSEGNLTFNGKSYVFDTELSMLFWYGSDKELKNTPDQAYLASIGLLTGNGKPVLATLRTYDIKPGSETLLMPYDGVDYWCGFALISKKAPKIGTCAC